jgi:hypothetical protein
MGGRTGTQKLLVRPSNTVLCATTRCCRREVERRTHPLSAADFALLESELEAWRQQQTAAIKAAGLDKQEEQVGPAWQEAPGAWCVLLQVPQQQGA